MGHRSHLLPVIPLLIILLAACSLGGGSSTQPSEATGTPPESGDVLTMVDANGETVQVPRPVPEYVEFMLDQVGAGETTRAEGIINGLRLMAGETTLEDLYGDQPVRIESGYGLTAMAAELYQTTDDEDVKAEIARLMAIIAPPQENLDYYAMPAGDAGLRPPGVAAPAASQAEQPIPCASIWANGFPTDVEDPPVCLLFRSFEEEGYQYRVYYPEERGDDAVFLVYVEAAVEAMRQSRAVYDPLSNMRSVNLVFTLLPSALETSAAEVPGIDESTYSGSACPISVFPSAITVSVDEFKQIVAHEMFHCLHFFREGISGFASGAWYQEGMAEYFSNVVYPDVNFEQRNAEDFNVNSSYKWLMDMSYENVVFFMYLGNRFGNPYLIDLMDELAYTDDTKDAQAAALADYGDMQTVFHDFGKAFLERNIADTGGGGWPIELYTLVENYFTIGESRELFMSTTPFTLQHYFLTLEEGREYDIARSTSGAPGKDAWRGPTPETFVDIPSTHRTTCGSDPHRLVLLTSAPPSASESLQSELELDFSSSEAAYLDCCLVGTWNQDTGEIRRKLETIISGYGTLVDVTGNFVLVVSREGVYTFTPVDYTGTVQLDDTIATVGVIGSSTGAVTTPERGTIRSLSETASFVETLSSEGGTVTIPLEGASLGGLPTGDFNYTCDERTLTTIIPPDLAPFGTSTYTRVSDIPATPEPEEMPAAPPESPSGPPDIGPGGGLCTQVAVAGFSASGSEARWTLQNTGATDMRITSISLNWPSENGAFEGITVAGTPLWSGSQSSPPAILSSGFSGGDELRTLPAGGSQEFSFSFNGASVGSSGYALVLDFDSGCLFSDVR